jgi:hypothetical protein
MSSDRWRGAFARAPPAQFRSDHEVPDAAVRLIHPDATDPTRYIV